MSTNGFEAVGRAETPRRPNPAKTHRKEELLTALEAVGLLRADAIALPGTSITVQVRRPDDLDLLLDQAADDPEQNLPYWAELWPSGIALAARIAQTPELVAGKQVLELGCGLGVTAIAALRAGAELLVTDYAPEALALCALNAFDQVGREPVAMQLNWRDPSAEFLQEAGRGFPIVLAADLLYESRDVEPLLDLMERIVAQDGELLLAEPGRRPAATFLTAVRERGWTIESQSCAGPWPDPEDNRKGIVVDIHRLTRPRKTLHRKS